MTHIHGSRSTLSQASSLSSSQVLQADSIQNKNNGVDGCEGEKYGRYLPIEIIFNILVFLPAQVLHDSMRFVCREWHNIVNDPVFLRTQFSLSSTGVFVQDLKQLSVHYLETINGVLKTREFTMPFKRYIQGSCCGLLLVRDLENAGLLHVFNPIRKTMVSLPPLPESYRSNQYNYTSLGFSSSGHFKAVHVWIQNKSSQVWIMVCTVGVDKVWRKIDVVNVPLSTYLVDVDWHVPYSIGRFIYWVSYSTSIGFVLDVDDETMHKFHTPGCRHLPIRDITRSIYLGTGFGWLESLRKEGQWLWKVWELTGTNSTEWTRVLVIDVIDLKRRLKKIFHPGDYMFSRPFLYLKEKHELWLHSFVGRLFTVVCFNVRSGKILSSIDNLQLHCKFSAYPHVNSLL